MTITIVPAAASTDGISVTPGTSSSSSEQISLDRRVPLEIPRPQVYYWSGRWRRDERESEEARERGEFRVFDDPTDPTDAARWLLSDGE